MSSGHGAGQEEFPDLKKRYWGQTVQAGGYFCGTAEEVDEEAIKDCVENQGKQEMNADFETSEE